MKKAGMVILVLSMIMFLPGCGKTGTGPSDSRNSQTSDETTASIGNSEEGLKTFLLHPSDRDVSEFENRLGDFPTGYEGDSCYNVTPSAFLNQPDIQIFKYDQSCAAFLLHGGEIYPLGEHFGGYGVTSFALADMDEDGNEELYFTFSWGSGIHRSQAGYFDFGKKTAVIFEYADFEEEIMLVVDQANKLRIYSSVFPESMLSFVNIHLKPAAKIADIVFTGNEIKLKFIN